MRLKVLEIDYSVNTIELYAKTVKCIKKRNMEFRVKNPQSQNGHRLQSTNVTHNLKEDWLTSPP